MTIYYGDISEDLQIADSNKMVLIPEEGVVDELAVSDVVAATVTWSGEALTEGLTIADRMFSLGPDEADEVIQVSDTVEIVRVFQGRIREDVEIADVLALATTFGPTITENVVVSDGMIVGLTYSPVLTEALTVDDVVRGLHPHVVENITVSDVVEIVKRRIPMNTFQLFMRRTTDVYEVDMMPIFECCDTADKMCCGYMGTDIGPGDSVLIRIIGGCPPFTWEVSALGTLEFGITQNRTNILHGSESGLIGDSITVTITDDCDTEINCTIPFVPDYGDDYGCCSDPDYTELAYENDGATIFMPAARKFLVEVTGGCPPFRWIVDNPNFWWNSEYTEGRKNVLNSMPAIAHKECCTAWVIEDCNSSVTFRICPWPEIPDDVGPGPYEPGPGDCADFTYTPVSWDDDNPTTGPVDGSVSLSVENGVGPFLWMVTGAGASFATAITYGRGNSMTCSSFCGTAEITVTDLFCGETCSGVVLSVDGNWTYQGYTDDNHVLSCNNIMFPYSTYVGDSGKYRYYSSAVSMSSAKCCTYSGGFKDCKNTMDASNVQPALITNAYYAVTAGDTRIDCCTELNNHYPGPTPCQWPCESGSCGNSNYACSAKAWFSKLQIFEWTC
jgi:hypothetical protein